MPQSYSNVFQPGGNTAKANPFGMFTAPARAANPFSMTAAIQNKSTPSPLKPAVTTATKSVQQPVKQQSQVTGTLSGSVNSQTPVQTQSAPAAPVYGNTTPSKNVVGTNPPNQDMSSSAATQPVNGVVPNNTPPSTTTGGVPNNAGLYGHLIGQGVQKLQEAGDYGSQAGLIKQAMQRMTRDVYGNPYYSGTVKTGLAGNIAQQQGSQLEGIAAQETALTGQGNAYLSGANAAAPVQVPYGTQYISPVTGQSPIGQGGSSSQQNPQTQAQTYAQEVLTGKRSYADAIAGMGLYGSVGKQFLDESIRTQNPNFNFAQAQTLGANQGAVGPAYQFAQTALQNVTDAMGKLSSLQTTNMPIVNAGANFVSTETGIGSEATRAVTGAVQTLRNAYASLLAANRGGTPTDYSAQASAEIPDKPTPNDIAAIKANFEALGGARAQIYGNPGSATNNPGGSTGGGGTAQAGGYSFVQDAQGNWVPAK